MSRRTRNYKLKSYYCMLFSRGLRFRFGFALDLVFRFFSRYTHVFVVLSVVGTR